VAMSRPTDNSLRPETTACNSSRQQFPIGQAGVCSQNYLVLIAAKSDFAARLCQSSGPGHVCRAAAARRGGVNSLMRDVALKYLSESACCLAGSVQPVDWSVVCLKRRGSSGQQVCRISVKIDCLEFDQRQHAEVVMRLLCLIQQPCKALVSESPLPALTLDASRQPKRVRFCVENICI
jgi:hypothetical protein